MRIVVTAASKHGSTDGIAEVIAGRLEELGADVDRPLPRAVGDLTDVDGIVVGSAIYAGRWLADAKDLVERLAAAGTTIPVWLFSSGPLGDPPTPAEEPADASAMVERIHPVEHRTFAGSLRREDLSLAERMVVKAVRAPYGDFRDRDAIRAWAEQIHSHLTPVTAA
ncbi:flavodoxin domain-containing protein [Euzebya sp.]|uniref:flavodoxin domain-containing protein n=1 Tax=Euzebya sp. TaxID=1971409 RepID=UPI003518D37A